MATAHEPRSAGTTSPSGRRRSGLFRWTVDQVYKLSEMGFFDDRHVELIDGVLFELTINPPHAVMVGLIAEVLRDRFGAGNFIRMEKPLDFGRRNLPEPDLAVVQGTHLDYLKGHPRTALLIVEVSDSTLRKDRVLKGHLYARAGIADYWLVNLNDRQVEVHRSPGPDPSRTGRYRYAAVTVVPADGRVAPLAAPEAVIAVADMLPPG
jgi:Uma2 family endonuclease